MAKVSVSLVGKLDGSRLGVPVGSDDGESVGTREGCEEGLNVAGR